MIDIDEPAGRATFAQLICALLEEFWRNAPSRDPAGDYRQVFGPGVRWVEFRNSDPVPNYAIAWRDDFLYIGIQGAGKLGVATKLHLGYIEPFSRRRDNGIHPFAEDMANVINRQVTNYVTPIPPRIIIGCHSFGGVVGIASAWFWRIIRPDANISVCSFGSPKVGDYRTPRACRGIDVCRWMGHDDACPWVPFSASQGPAMWALLTTAQARNSTDYLQPTVGSIIDANGIVSHGEYPPVPDGISQASLVAWILGADNQSRESHLLATYNRRLVMLRDRIAKQEVPVGAEQLPLPQQALPVAPVRPPNNAPVPVVELPVLTAPRPGPAGVSDNPYYSTVENHLPVCKYDSLTIAVCKTRRQARDLARTLNTAYRRWNRTRVGDQAAMQQSVVELFLP